MTRVALPLLLCTAATAMAHGAEPKSSPGALSARELYRAQCGGCHLENGFGTRVLARRVPTGQALLEQREEIDARFVKLVVRRGLGSMPQIRRTELSDGDLERIAQYLEDGE